MRLSEVEHSKQDYTDQYVSIDSDRAELARFRGLVGQVKTVNMSGRALVQWLDYHENIGWYDIPLADLKLVDKPAPAEPAVATKPAKATAKKPTTGLSPLEQLRKQGGSRTPERPPAAEPKSTGLSPLEQLRQQGGTKKPADAPADEAQGASSKKPSTADILAKLRAQKAQQGDTSDDQ